MDEQRAIKLLDDTFNTNFDINRYSIFVKELFNKFDVSPKSWQVWTEYKGYIDSYQLLGSYRDDSKKAIDVLVVKLNKETVYKDRARTKQRNFIAKYLGNANKDAALVAFYGDDPQDWRFSFVKMEYQLSKDGSISKDLTPAKRYSFLVGLNEPNHTCRRQFLKLVMEEEINPSLENIEESFGIENITKEFFSNYKDRYLDLRDSLEKVIEKDPNVNKEFTDKSVSTVDFSKKLLGQIVFIYFLQKKGWLGVGRNPETGKFKEWGSGPKNFLRKLFNKEIVQYDNFFNDILEPLFYEALATERDDDYYSRFNCKIPFLNGGLFEPINDYDWKGPGIRLENSIFESIFETFDRFNFTVKEDEPLDKEVAVDPEMLGKVFENLLDVIDRKSKGAFYTPREDVHHMCQQSLIYYLGTNTGIPLNDIENFIQHGDLAQQITSNSDVYEKYLPVPIKENCKKIDDLLKNIKIVDLAVGSGAFPMGMMNEIVKARSILSFLLKNVRNNYDLKRETIENSLYGADIDSSAVDIAKLRFWLSLIVDESDMTKIKPLPNLDHKIMCGNSLLEEFEGVKLFDEKLLEEIPKHDSSQIEQIKIEMDQLNQELGEIYTGKKSQRKLAELKKFQKIYFNEQNRKLKKQYAEEIDKIEWGLIEETLKEQGNEIAMQKLQQYKKNKSKPFFLWKLYFSEIYQRDNPGFDVVIGNPPYVRQESIKHFKVSLESTYKVYNSTSDLYTYFYELGFNVLRNHGVLTFITSNKWMRTAYGKNLRQFFLDNTTLMEIINFGGKAIFESATVDTNILIFKKEIPSENHLVKINTDLPEIGNPSKLIPQSKFNFALGDAETQPLKTKIENQGTPLKDWNITINYGVKTGFNKAFIIDTETKERLCKEDPKNAEIIRPILRGRNIKKYSCEWAGLYLINTHNGFVSSNGKKNLPIDIETYPKIKLFLDTFWDDISKRQDNGLTPYNLRNCAYIDDFQKEKIMYPNMTAFLPFYYDIHGFFSNDKSFIITGESLKYLVAFLNSNLFKFAFKDYFPELLGGTRELRKVFFDKIPVKKISLAEEKPFIDIVDQILSITSVPDHLDSPEKKARVKTLEKEIDQLVYKLYVLTPEEINIVENFYNGKQQ